MMEVQRMMENKEFGKKERGKTECIKCNTSRDNDYNYCTTCGKQLK